MNDENKPEEVILAEVPRLMDRLEHACANLGASVKKLEERCASAISDTPKAETDMAPAPALCPLARALRAYAMRIETACENIDSLRARLEL